MLTDGNLFFLFETPQSASILQAQPCPNRQPAFQVNPTQMV